jgi:hypothetical protein
MEILQHLSQEHHHDQQEDFHSQQEDFRFGHVVLVPALLHLASEELLL